MAVNWLSTSVIKKPKKKKSIGLLQRFLMITWQIFLLPQMSLVQTHSKVTKYSQHSLNVTWHDSTLWYVDSNHLSALFIFLCKHIRRVWEKSTHLAMDNIILCFYWNDSIVSLKWLKTMQQYWQLGNRDHIISGTGWIWPRFFQIVSWFQMTMMCQL